MNIRNYTLCFERIGILIFFNDIVLSLEMQITACEGCLTDWLSHKKETERIDTIFALRNILCESIFILEISLCS